VNIYLHIKEARARAGDPGKGQRGFWMRYHEGEGRGRFNHGYHTFAAYISAEDGKPHLFLAEPGSTRQARVAGAVAWAQRRFGSVDQDLLKALESLPRRNSRNRVQELAAVAQALVERGCTDKDWEDMNRSVVVTD
jgi:hypothetical protein